LGASTLQRFSLMSVLHQTYLDHSPTEKFLSFGPFRLRVAERLLTKEGKPVHLGARAMSILIELIDQAGQVVSKKELAIRVWPGVVVEEAALRFHIAALRKTLGDGNDGARYILTLARQGYCFVAPIVHSTVPKMPTADDTVTQRRSMLPRRLTRMVGRDETVSEITSQLMAMRFVTLVGPGGMGKTTVALAVGHALLDNFDGAVHFIDFGSINDPALAPSVLASALGLIVHAEDPVPGIIKVLRTKPCLLVLDSCEPVIDAAAELAERINQDVPCVCILATSREKLCAEGEYAYWLPPLESPPDDAELTAAQALTYPAAQLLVERLIASGQRFELSDLDAPLLAKVCRKLDGVALAIELAAGSMNAYGLEGIASLLDSSLTLVWKGRRTAAPRHQTLRATFDWSYDLLPEPERLVLRRLSVFIGTFTLEAAIAVAGNGDVLVVSAIASLVMKSLVTVHQESGKTCYRLLDTTRAYAFEKLNEIGENREIASRHAIYYRDLLDLPAVPPSAGVSGSNECLSNVRVALNWAFSSHGDIEVGIALAVNSARLFLELSLLTECHHWTERAVATLGDARGTHSELILQSELGLSLMFTRGNSDEACAALKRALALAEQLNDVNSQLRLLVRLHFFAERMGDFHGALAFAERGEIVARNLANPLGIAAAHSMLGSSHHIMGNHAAARRHLETAAARTHTSPRLTTINYGFDPCSRAAVVMARNLWVLGYSDQATALARRTVAWAEASGHPIPICIALIWAVSTYFGTGDWASCEENINMFSAHADKYSLESYYAVGQGATGKLLVRRGEAEAGVKLLEAALETLHARRYVLHIAGFNSALAEGWAMLGQCERALTIVEGTISLIGAGGNLFRMPELLRLKGTILCKQRFRAGEECLLESIHLADEQSALAWQLRAASDLARLWVSRGRIREARDVLAPVYSRFTEGFECVDLKAAAQLLEEIGQPRASIRRYSS
jgi:predicted ATPase/DNA-binding winged helix-turn-helix (wHTH) protein